jgi:hypothetical protein
MTMEDKRLQRKERMRARVVRIETEEKPEFVVCAKFAHTEDKQKKTIWSWIKDKFR